MSKKRSASAESTRRPQPPTRPGWSNRAVATRFDKLAARFEATVLIASIGEWLRPARAVGSTYHADRDQVDRDEKEAATGAQYYGADSENGDRIDAPSEDALFRMISDLNTFVVVQPDEDDPVWFASVAVLGEGGYEIVRRDTIRNEHKVTAATSINGIARDLTIWMATRNFPGRPTRQA